MSYILDALKKADAQRERDPARGIHAQPAALVTARPGDGSSPWLWAAAAAALAAVSLGGWYMAQDRAPAPPAVPSAAPAPRLAPVAAATPAGVGSAPAPRLPAVSPPTGEPQVASAVLPPPQPAQGAPSTDSEDPIPGTTRRRRHRVGAPVTAVGSAIPAAAASNQAVAPTRAASAAAVAAAPGPAAAPAAQPSVATGLPPDAPRLAISGGVYSASRSQRMLIVNGQVVGEGADLGAGAVLEEIKPKAAVLRFRGARYTVGF